MNCIQDDIVRVSISLDSEFTHILFNLAAQGYEILYVDYVYSIYSPVNDNETDSYIHNYRMYKTNDNVSNSVRFEDELHKVLETHIQKIIDNHLHKYGVDTNKGYIEIYLTDDSYTIHNVERIVKYKRSKYAGKF